MENLVKTMENGVIFYLRGTTCYDMNIPDNVKELILECDGMNAVSMRRIKRKAFPQIEKIFIGHEMRKILISNRSFPNVREIESESKFFESGKMLIQNDDIYSWGGSQDKKILYNSFCLAKEDIIDMKNISKIEDEAFEACESINIINTQKVEIISANAFSGSAFLDIAPKDGVVIAGTLALFAQKDAAKIIFPDYITAIRNEIYMPMESEAIINCPDIFFRCLSNSIWSRIPEKIVLNGNLTVQEWIIKNLVKINNRIKAVEINGSDIYTTKDGIIYNKDMTKLIVCPCGLTGDIKIADSVVAINDSAFEDSLVKSVIIPNSVKTIGKEAFSNCKELESVIIGNNVELLGYGCFYGAISLKEIEIPGSVRFIPQHAFSFCIGLNNLILHEGTKTIDESILNGTPLKHLEIPKSVTDLKPQSLASGNLAHIKFKAECFPKDVVNAVVPKVDSHNLMPTLIENKKSKVYLPPCMTQNSMNFLDTKAQEDGEEALHEAYTKAAVTISKQLTALMEALNGNEKVYPYISRSAKPIVEYLIKKGMEEEICRLLKSGILSKTSVAYIHKNIPEHMRLAKSYALETLSTFGGKKTGFKL